MPVAPPRAHHCGGRITNGVCDRCGPSKRNNAYDRQRGSAAERGYDYTWQQFRLSYLAMHPLCVDCEREGRAEAATDIHHRQKLRDRPELKYEESNLMGLCKRHHDQRTARGE